MTTRTDNERAAKVALAVVAIIGLLVPAIVGLIVGATPDTTMRVGDVGTFVTSNTSAGGFFTLSATTLQTSTGSIVVSRPLSVVRGQRLQVEDRLKSGLHLCVHTTPPTCADVTGQWTGQMQPVQHQRHAFAWLAARMSILSAVTWFLAGLIATLITMIALGHAGGWAPNEVPSEALDPSGSEDTTAKAHTNIS
jgi:hypothetical protein